MTDRIAIVGLMGSGKSTLARELSDRLDLPVVDSDDQLRARHGMEGRRYAELHGLDQLHLVEASLLAEALGTEGGMIVTPAASTIEVPELRGRLRTETFVVWLDLPISVLMSRIPSGDHRRPVTEADLAALRARRGPLYAEVAHLTITEPLAPGDLGDAVIEAVRNHRSGT